MQAVAWIPWQSTREECACSFCSPEASSSSREGDSSRTPTLPSCKSQSQKLILTLAVDWGWVCMESVPFVGGPWESTLPCRLFTLDFTWESHILATYAALAYFRMLPPNSSDYCLNTAHVNILLKQIIAKVSLQENVLRGNSYIPAFLPLPPALFPITTML